MLAAGAAGYLLQTEPLGTVAAAVRAVTQGQQQWMAEQMARILHWREEAQKTWESLTKREREVLRLLAWGWDNRRIAGELCLTEQTVKNHVSHSYAKLRVCSRAEAVAWAWEHGLGEHPRHLLREVLHQHVSLSSRHTAAVLGENSTRVLQNGEKTVPAYHDKRLPL
ncbi:MAG: response regulator transcription factor [Chloroflexota bacterium]|nr:response regulator transcription factor [Chloroflexota bacterium]